MGVRTIPGPSDLKTFHHDRPPAWGAQYQRISSTLCRGVQVPEYRWITRLTILADLVGLSKQERIAGFEARTPTGFPGKRDHPCLEKCDSRIYLAP